MATWRDPALDPQYIDWARETAAVLEPWSLRGGYVNYMQADEPLERVRSAFGERDLRATPGAEGLATTRTTSCGATRTSPADPVSVVEIETPHRLARAHLHGVESPRAALVLGHGAARRGDGADLVAAP